METKLTGVRYADVLKGLETKVYVVSLNWFAHADGALENAKLVKLHNPSAKRALGVDRAPLAGLFTIKILRVALSAAKRVVERPIV